ncbi:FAD:protein FMN transferase [Candidatus Erwinia haradaeae]|uniref:FAD:protein FMN transferase n=1 Tax=Candidatus Erwinia haradaeae TaxID=1922217 RepID=A0A451D516_9GAMM|nr:FAD:protein FMN transferase [Candidatus Erwinia haradaeae]VFP80833.1 FAD:protein FMN transferase [Candidatus Erwinia haradaeae]
MNKIWQCFIGCILIFLQIPSANSQNLLYNEKIVLTGHTMGTNWKVSVSGVNSIDKHTLKCTIQHILDKDNDQLSTWKNDSIISKFNKYRGINPQLVTREIADIITQALRIGYQMNGAMDITIGSLVNLWGFGPKGFLIHLPTESQINTARALTGAHHLKVINISNQSYLYKDLPEISIDLSSVGEGFATDHLAQFMEDKGIKNYLVSVGGAVRAHGQKSKYKNWKVGIQKPTDLENSVQDIITLNKCAVSTAGTYRNYYEINGQRFSHLINPVTGRPTQNTLVSVSVIASTAFEADCWDSGLLILDVDKAKELAQKYKKAVYLISQNGDKFTTWVSPKFSAFIQSSKVIS